MAKYFVQFDSTAAEGADQAVNRWYDGVLVQDVLGVPGSIACQRYCAVGSPGLPVRYVADYEAESGDPQAILATMIQASAGMQISPGLDQSSVSVSVLEPIGARRTR